MEVRAEEVRGPADGRQQHHLATGAEFKASAVSEAVQVVVSCDDGYARHLCILLLSLFEYTVSRSVQVHVLVPEGFVSQQQLRQALGNKWECLSFHYVRQSIFAGFTLNKDYSHATYFRMLMADFLPADLGRVIFLDTDMMVVGDISDLWAIPLGDAVIAAVPDPGYQHDGVLGLLEYEPYFNAGVLLIDLVRWRREQVGRRAFAFAEAHADRLVHMDQCALNWVLRDRWRALSPTWNVQTHALGEYVNKAFVYFKPVPRLLARARIIHFNTPGRPWLYADDHPCKQQYLDWQSKTPWAHEPPVGRYRSAIVRKALARHVPALVPAFKFLNERVFR